MKKNGTNIQKGGKVCNRWKKYMYYGVLMAFLGTLFTFTVTALGALNVFFIKNASSTFIQRIFLGFAGGVMIAASIWSLIIPAIDLANERKRQRR